VNKVYIDFETRSRIDIKKSGAGRYCTDPSTEILCVAFALNDEPVQYGLRGYYPPIFDVWQKEGYIFVAHNAFFESMIWEYVWGRTPPEFMCTMSKACAHGLPWNMGKLARSLKLPEQKDIEGQRLIRLFSMPNKEGVFNTVNEYPEDFDKFVRYCKQDVQVERQIDRLLPDLTPKEQKIFQLTQNINKRGVHVDTELAENAMNISTDLRAHCNKEVAEITEGKILAVTQTVRLKNWINETYEVFMNGVSSDDIEEWLGKDIPEEMRRLLTLRLEHGRSSVAKFSRVIDSCCDDGRIRNHLIYHGASTGRWTSQAVQFQNLPRGGNIDQDICMGIINTGDASLIDWLYSKPVSALSSCVRGVVVAPENKTLLVADYASIEARVLMWVADQKDAIEMFKQKKDIYVEMAKAIYRNPNLTPKDKNERQLGKQAVLGCGFQMGANRFKVTCEGYGIEIDEKLAEKAVAAYRDTYKKVPSFWAKIEQAALYTVRYKKPCPCGPVTFYIKGKFLYCELPSGRSLAYYYPGIEEKEMPWGKLKQSLYYYTVNSETKDFKKTHTYGGKLTENVVQAIARDIMAEAMLRLEEEGMEIVLSVHDEIVCERYQHTYLKNPLERMIMLMCKVPDWAEGCPIDAEGWSGKRYKK
jgi:DNA polymerase